MEQPIVEEVKEEEYTSINSEEAAAEEMKKISEMAPFDQIRYAADKFGVVLRDPKPSCRKCYGRGYIGIRYNPITEKNEEPIACACVHPVMTEARKHEYDNRGFLPKNRRERRLAEKLSKKYGG
jgi:hypothetical protein